MTCPILRCSKEKWFNRCPSWASKALHWGPRWRAFYYGFKVIVVDAMRKEPEPMKITVDGVAGLTKDFIELAKKMSPEYKAAMIGEIENATSNIFKRREACPERLITVLGRRPGWDPRGEAAKDL